MAEELASVKDIGAAREDAIRKNMTAVVEHGNTTRNLLVDQGEQVQMLRNAVATMQEQMIILNDQLSALQVKVFSGGSTAS